MISDAVTSPYYARAIFWPRVLQCIIILLSVMISPDIEKTHHASLKTSPCVNPPEFNGAKSCTRCTIKNLTYTPASVGSILSPCVYEDFAGSNSLLSFLMLLSMVLSLNLVTMHHTSSKTSRRGPLHVDLSGVEQR